MMCTSGIALIRYPCPKEIFPQSVLAFQAVLAFISATHFPPIKVNDGGHFWPWKKNYLVVCTSHNLIIMIYNHFFRMCIRMSTMKPN